MKNTKMKQSIAALAMAAVVAVSLLGYGCGSKPASTTGAGATGDFTGTAKALAAMYRYPDPDRRQDHRLHR